MSNYPPQQQPYYPAPKKRHTVRNVILGVVIGLVLVIGGCMAVIGAGAKAASDSIDKASAPVKYRYHVEGKGTATITYMSQSGMSQQGDVQLPFDREETFSGIIKAANVTATVGQKGGEVTCQVLDEAGKVLAENKASGAFASCSASPQPEMPK